MSKFISDKNNEIEQKILTALHVCYGSLDEPNFRKVSNAIRGGLYHNVIKSLQEIGAEITETTDLNDDVSVRLALDRAGDHVSLSLSGVGLFAAVLHRNPKGQYSWVTHPEKAPTLFSATVARIVQQAGFQLLDRSLVSQSIATNWWDGSTEVTLYQLLFTDNDVTP